MAADPRSYLTAAIIIGVFSIVALFGGITIPLVERGKLNDQITSDQMLTREQSLAWGSVPGTRNINYQKTFTLLTLNGTSSEDILEGKANLVPAATATYNYSYQYKNLQYTPATNGSVQFYNFYNHTYQGDESDLLDMMVDTVDVGVFRAITQQANMSPAQVFIQTLYRIYTGFQQDIVTLLISDYVFEFYIKNQDLTNQTIFMYDNLVTAEVSDKLWNDPEYGWSQASTLLSWVTVAYGYYNNPSYNPQTVPEYILLKNHFSLTDAQMMTLISGQAGNTTSMLYNIIYAVQSTIAGVNGCKSTTGCVNTEMFSLQFFQANITKNPVFHGIPPKNSVAEMNATYPQAPEIAAMNQQNVYFDSDTADALFSLNGDLPVTTQQTLFGLQNVEMILQNQQNPAAVASYMNLDGPAQAQVIIDYVNYIINEFTYLGQSNLQAAKFSADTAVNNMNNLPGDMGSLMSINVTAIGTYNLMLQQNATCESLLNNVSIPANVTTTICENPDYTLNTSHGQAPWVAAYFAGDGSNVYTLIESVTGIADSDLYNLMQPGSSQFATNIQTVLNAIATAVGCGSGPCSSSFIASVQWATSGFTKNLPAPYFTQTYDSLADMDGLKEHFENFIPEFPVFANRTLGVNINMTLDAANALFSYDVGSINNNYEVLRLIYMAQSGNYSGIQTRFGFDQTETNAIFAYFDQAFLYYYLGGLIQSISAYDLLWGYTDPFLANMNNQNFMDTVMIFNPEISLLGDKDNSDDSSDVPYNMINSGSDNPSSVRQMTAYNGNATLSLNQTSFDGNTYYWSFVPVWGGDLQYISGTDGSGFAPLMDTDTQITVFEGSFFRNLNYNYQKTITKDYNSNSYEFNQYQLDTSQLATSKIFYNNVDGYMNLTSFDNTPVVISLPYFKACDDNSYSGITFNNQPASSYQSSVDPGTFSVEALTGITDTFTKSYQYNIYNSMPFFLSLKNNLAAIPLFQVTESYSTPTFNYQNDLQSYQSRSKGITIAMIVVLVIAFLLMVTSGVLFRMYFVNRKKLDASRLNANPGDYASLGIDSDGARSSLHPLTQAQ